jgi:hypothetical protein
MFKAMQAGAGSLSTTHAHDARAAIERPGDLRVGGRAARHLRVRLPADRQPHRPDRPDRRGRPHRPRRRKSRYVSEVLEVARGEGGRPAISDLFAPGPDGRAVPRTRPSFLADLRDVGFDPGWLDQRDGTWTPAAPEDLR